MIGYIYDKCCHIVTDIYTPGGMIDLSTPANGYGQAHSPNSLPGNSSPGLLSKGMGVGKHSPPPGTRPNLRVVIPNQRGDLPVSDTEPTEAEVSSSTSTN